MDRSELFASLAAAAPRHEDVVYVERSGTSYSWRRATPGTESPVPSPAADVWIYFSGPWPRDPLRLTAFCEDLLAEMESMAGGDDRCRWPLDQPWPMAH